MQVLTFKHLFPMFWLLDSNLFFIRDLMTRSALAALIFIIFGTSLWIFFAVYYFYLIYHFMPFKMSLFL